MQDHTSSRTNSSPRRIAVPVLVKDGKPTASQQPSSGGGSASANNGSSHGQNLHMQSDDSSNDCPSSSSSPSPGGHVVVGQHHATGTLYGSGQELGTAGSEDRQKKGHRQIDATDKKGIYL